jgi:ribosome modulation factor
MGNHSPSRYRRDGRNAFYRGGDARHHVPYPVGSSHRSDWLEGWLEAERDDQDKMKLEAAAEVEDQEKVEEFARLYNRAKEQGLI